MTRKRYIKLLMALGVERNKAEAYARQCRETGRTYKQDYYRRYPWLTMQKAFRKLGRSVLGVGNVLGRMSAAANTIVSSLAAGPIAPVEPIRPNCGQDGLRIAFSVLDEMHNVPGAEMRRTL